MSYFIALCLLIGSVINILYALYRRTFLWRNGGGRYDYTTPAEKEAYKNQINKKITVHCTIFILSLIWLLHGAIQCLGALFG